MLNKVEESLIDIDVVLGASGGPCFVINTAVYNVNNGGKVSFVPKRESVSCHYRSQIYRHEMTLKTSTQLGSYRVKIIRAIYHCLRDRLLRHTPDIR